MEQRSSSDKRFALLIDADNVSARYIKPILNELSKYGAVTVKRIYGDWTLSLHAKWKDALLENSITPIQQFGYTQGKNATDSAMIIDAMDILYTNSVDGFCIVSSDSDFTRLASRLREGGHMVIGMGEKKTPTPFRRACDVFTTLELLIDKREKSGSNGPSMSKEEVEQAVVDIITDNQNNGKATGLGEVGSRLLKRYPDFDVRSYGTNLLSKLLSEFSRIRITRDHNSIAVELADATDKADTTALQQAEPAGALEQEAPAESTDSLAASPNSEESAATADKAEEPAAPSKRSRRSHRVSANAPHDKAKASEKDAATPKPEQTAEAAEAEAEAEAAPSRAEAQVGASEPAATPDVSAQSTPGDANETTAAKKPSRRRRRKPAGKTPASENKSDNPAEAEKPEQAEPATPQEAEPAAASAPKASAEEAPEPKPAPKPKARRGRKPKAAVEQAPAEREPQPEANATPNPATPPAPEAEPMPEPAPKPKTRRGRKPKTRPQTDRTPQDFIRQMVLDAGAAGIELSQIGDAVRAQYKDFKVRDLGFSRLLHYVESIDDFSIEKVGKNTYVKLAD